MEKAKFGCTEGESELEPTPPEEISLGLSPDTINVLVNQPAAQMCDAIFMEHWGTNAPPGLVGSGMIELNNFYISEATEQQDIGSVYTGIKQPFTDGPLEDCTALSSLPSDHPPEPPKRPPCCPTTTSFEGEYDFYINCAPQKKMLKAASWAYDEKCRKLYAKCDMVCPIQVHTKKEPPKGTILRAMPVYLQPEHARDVVFRCKFHKEEENNGPVSDHLVRCENEGAQYHDNEGRLSVSILLDKPQAGMTYQVIHYRFMCLSSCKGGMNRRPMKLVFTLEHNDEVVGRMSIDVKICTCPGRDLRLAQKAVVQLPDTPSAIAGTSIDDTIPSLRAPKREATSVLNVAYGGPSKTTRRSYENGEDGQVYQLKCSSKETYDRMKFLRDAVEYFYSRDPANAPASSPPPQQNSSPGAGRVLVNRLLAAAESKSLQASQDNGSLHPDPKSSTAGGDLLAVAPADIKLEQGTSHENVEDVPIERWLEDLNIPSSYVAGFHERGFRSTRDLVGLSIKDLQSLGMASSEQQKVMYAVIQLHIHVPHPPDSSDQHVLQASSQGQPRAYSQESNAS